MSSSSSCNDMRSFAPDLLRPRRNGAAAGPGRTPASGLRGLRARDIGPPEMSENVHRAGKHSTASAYRREGAVTGMKPCVATASVSATASSSSNLAGIGHSRKRRARDA